MVVLPFCFTPSLIDCVALASVNSAWTFGSVRSLALNVFPIFVSAFPIEGEMKAVEVSDEDLKALIAYIRSLK
jgi:hypothetical protein